MPDTGPLPEGRALLRRHRIELLWLAFAALNVGLMLLLYQWQSIPFYLIWISFTIVYGFRVRPSRVTFVALALVMVVTAIVISVRIDADDDLWAQLSRVPMMGAMFLAVAWQARRRVAALQVAENRSEERQSMLQRQERFIHDASHELRTPLTIARGHLELARTHGEGEDGAELDIALDELDRIDAIISRLLLLANADQPDFLQLSVIPIEPFLEDVFIRWSEVAPRAWRLGPLAEGELAADPERLRVALDALIENAVKYTKERDSIELGARSGAGETLVIEVRDEGCGVPEEAFERIFDRFARVDPARTRSDGGVGLGLAIVDAIAKGHGGWCTVHAADRGSIFALHLPAFRPARSELAVAAAG
jgi:signal transduction histidine kinase